MESAGQDKGETSIPNAPVFFTMTFPKGKKSEPEDEASPMMKGKAEGMNLKRKARQWAGVGGTGKAMIEGEQRPIHHTMEAYGKEKERISLFETKEGEKIELERQETICRNEGRYCGEPRQDKGKGKKIEWGPTSILPGTVFQLVERQESKKKKRMKRSL